MKNLQAEKITTIIFSYNRAVQLNMLLESITKYDHKKQLELQIVYRYSNADFHEGYLKLKGQYNIGWHEEHMSKKHYVLPVFPLYWRNYFWWLKYKYIKWVDSDFRNIVSSILKSSTNDNVMFLTDDSLFIRDIELQSKVLHEIRHEPLATAYSLRHGMNIYGGVFEKKERLIKWDRYYNHHSNEWSYSFSLDGHIYSKEALIKKMNRIIFKNPNTLEGNMACYANEKKLFVNHYANLNSCLVGFELNRVQSINNNHNLNIDYQKLNILYLNGYKLGLTYSLEEPHLFRPSLINVFAYNEKERIELYEN